MNQSADTPAQHSPWRITASIVAVGMPAMSVMFWLLAAFPIASPVLEGVIGTSFMVALMVPTIYVILLRPMRREILRQTEAAQALREVQAGLEERVRERTADIEEANHKVQQSLQALEQTHRETMLISELLELLQACGTAPESQSMMDIFGPRLFPEERGGIYLYRASRNVLELATGWGERGTHSKMFAPEDCWALRRGREHVSHADVNDVWCQHLPRGHAKTSGAMCVPMMAHGETTGLLVLERPGGAIPEATQKRALLVAERTGLALANLQLREKLRDQAIRDPLTAMYNRRYFEETATRELLRAEDSGAPIGMIMIDVDHFKRFNDSHGHDAGDAVLQRVGLTLQSHTRVEDVICRYGGEEFLMLLPGLPVASIVARAEELRNAIRDLSVRFRGETLGRITVSCGVSVFPEQGRACSDLIDAADHALYHAKEAGRDRVEVAA
jgi:diguanylate cyclase (GGDEF)-like protein